MRKALVSAVAKRSQIADGAVMCCGASNTPSLPLASHAASWCCMMPRRSLIHVPGQPAHLKRRLIDWLKAEAAHDLDVASTKYANAMEARFRKLNVRDQKSRWGSCSLRRCAVLLLAAQSWPQPLCSTMSPPMRWPICVR